MRSSFWRCHTKKAQHLSKLQTNITLAITRSGLRLMSDIHNKSQRHVTSIHCIPKSQVSLEMLSQKGVQGSKVHNFSIKETTPATKTFTLTSQALRPVIARSVHKSKSTIGLSTGPIMKFSLWRLTEMNFLRLMVDSLLKTIAGPKQTFSRLIVASLAIWFKLKSHHRRWSKPPRQQRLQKLSRI